MSTCDLLSNLTCVFKSNLQTSRYCTTDEHSMAHESRTKCLLPWTNQYWAMQVHVCPLEHELSIWWGSNLLADIYRLYSLPYRLCTTCTLCTTHKPSLSISIDTIFTHEEWLPDFMMRKVKLIPWTCNDINSSMHYSKVNPLLSMCCFLSL